MTSQLLKMDDSKSGETRIDELTSGKEIKRQLIRAMKEVSTAASQYTQAIWPTISFINLIQYDMFAIFKTFKGSPDPSHFIFEINVGKRRIRRRPTLNLNAVIFYRF